MPCCAFYESIHGIHHDVTLPVCHNHWMEPLAEFVRLAVESTTPPAPVAVPKVADLRKKERWRHEKVDGATVVEYLHDRRGSQAQVWAGMFASSDANKDDDSSQMDIDVAGAGASKDCDSPIYSGCPQHACQRLVAARDFKSKAPIAVLVGKEISPQEAKDLRGSCGDDSVILRLGRFYDVRHDNLCQNRARRMRNPLIGRSQATVRLMKGSQAKGSPFCYWTIRASRNLKRGDVLQYAAGATQDISGAIDRSIAATSGSYDGAGDGAKEVDDDQDNDGEAHRDVSTAVGGPDVPFDAVTSFEIGMLPDGPPTYKENPLSLHMPKGSVLGPIARRPTRIAIKTSCESVL